MDDGCQFIKRDNCREVQQKGWSETKSFLVLIHVVNLGLFPSLCFLTVVKNKKFNSRKVTDINPFCPRPPVTALFSYCAILDCLVVAGNHTSYWLPSLTNRNGIITRIVALFLLSCTTSDNVLCSRFVGEVLWIFKVARWTRYRCRKMDKSPTVSSGEPLLDKYMLVFASKCSPCLVKK